jgi:hypothetical protein
MGTWWGHVQVGRNFEEKGNIKLLIGGHIATQIHNEINLLNRDNRIAAHSCATIVVQRTNILNSVKFIGRKWRIEYRFNAHEDSGMLHRNTDKDDFIYLVGSKPQRCQKLHGEQDKQSKVSPSASTIYAFFQNASTNHYLTILIFGSNNFDLRI